MLSLPVEPMLAAPTPTLPGTRALRGGSWYEPKFDGYRAIVSLTSTHGARIHSRRGTDMTTAFPDIAAAASGQLAPGTVVDGELVMWTDGRPDFAALQRRLSRRKNAAALAAQEPAHLVLFDVLVHAGLDLQQMPFKTRRRYLERIATSMHPPLQLIPGTSDLDTAQQWLDDYSRADVGVEGLVVKGLATPYTPGQRGWLKYKLRDTAEAIVGAVIGTHENAERLVLGRYDGDGVLRIVGSTHELHRPQRLELREHLVTAGDDHPWPPEIAPGGLGHWGGRDRIRLHRVDPVVVVEISADRAFDNGRWRHLTKYVRIRLDLDPAAVSPR